MNSKPNTPLSNSSKVIHNNQEKNKQGYPFNQGPVFASTFHLAGDPDNTPYQYGRYSNPGWNALEHAIGELEGGTTVIFPSGMAAITAVFAALLKTGDTLILPADGYYSTADFIDLFFTKFGVHAKRVPTLEIPALDLANIKLIFAESPSNPMLDVIDIRALSHKTKAAGTLLVIDNTTSTILGQQPLALGADISLASDTKAFSGHSDLLLGHVASKNDHLIEKIRNWRKLSGSIPGPMETWLAHRSLATLDVRLERMVNNARRVAEMLREHPTVKQIRYPGLDTDPSYSISQQQMLSPGFIISFELENKTIAETFLNQLALIYQATSFGGLHSTAERRARWGGDNIAEGVIRMSIGCEHAEDLLNDISTALNKL